MSIETLMTAEQLLRMPRDGCRYELIEGELQKMSPPGWRHGGVESRVDRLLGTHVDHNDLGLVLTGDPGFLIARDPDTVRAPDVAFVAKQRLAEEAAGDAYWPGAPDLAVEIVSPGDTLAELDDKVAAWLAAGTRMVWVVNPKWRSITVYRSPHDIRLLTEKDDLSGEDVVAGFQCPVAAVFGNL
jgi:Uma2 family endonuclease